MSKIKSDLMKKVAVRNADYTMKLVPGMKEEGFFDPKAREEIDASVNNNDTGGFGSNNQNQSLEEIRAGMGWKKANYAPSHELTIKNQTFDTTVPARTYVQTALKDSSLPTIIFEHGGGFFGGSLNNVEFPCQALADYGAVRVVSVDYGLAPEHPYPVGLLDSYRVLRWIYENADSCGVDSKKITVMGDSAGGTLSYNLATLDCEFGTNYLNKLVALYPVTYGGKKTELRSRFDSPEGLKAKKDQSLIAQYIRNFNGSSASIDDWYIHGADNENMYLSPLNIPSNVLVNFPKTLFMVGEFDPLRLQGEAFYQKMKLAGGNIQYIRYNGMVHAFMDKVGDFRQANDALQEAIQFVLK
ncbi:alpha/beta hydrolase [Pediococcus cellicola]|uniref:Lipolytic protein n=1 Tax=Pediococcus cellicola TaxID=319652 RepID=A0A0R2IJ55_9LACO|nr:alpha/beta hydrolase [Pediococcus cellicola]KRN65009.1 lipolytic protein [Pediococcus cellicola]GEL15907.1 hypothetical protein PCE01_17090 [Pediococcus cellicola]